MSDEQSDEAMAARREVLMQTAVYCGVPAANHAFALAQRVMEEYDEENPR